MLKYYMKVILAAMMSLHIVSAQKIKYLKHMLHFKYLLNLKHLLDDTLSERLILMLRIIEKFPYFSKDLVH